MVGEDAMDNYPLAQGGSVVERLKMLQVSRVGITPGPIYEDHMEGQRAKPPCSQVESSVEFWPKGFGLKL